MAPPASLPAAVRIARHRESRFWLWSPVWAAALTAAVAMLFPVVRAFYLVYQVRRAGVPGFGFNEGWNVYAARAVFHGQKIYAHPPAWLDFNYPALSFHIVAWLHRFGASYLFAGRFLSLGALVVSAVLVALLARRLGAAWRYALFAAFFCLAIFALAARSYVAQDDPQILAQMFFLAGLYVYVRGRPGWRRLAAVAALFVIGGNIKHNLLDFPLAVFLDLLLFSRRAAAKFAALGAAFLALSIAWERAANGPYLIADLLSARRYFPVKALAQFFRFGFAPLELAFAAAALWAVFHLRAGPMRVIAIWFWAALGVGFIFGGGDGVFYNAYFDLFLAIAVIAALFLPWLLARQGWRECRAAEIAVPLVLLATLLPPAVQRIRFAPLFRLPARQMRFEMQARFIRRQPGPAICESTLLCARAGKRFIYDPFNATERVLTGKLDPRPLLAEVRAGQIGAVQLFDPAPYFARRTRDLVFPALAAAVQQNYRLAWAGKFSYIYVPRHPAAPHRSPRP